MCIVAPSLELPNVVRARKMPGSEAAAGVWDPCKAVVLGDAADEDNTEGAGLPPVRRRPLKPSPSRH
jgi:hypothetical protein